MFAWRSTPSAVCTPTSPRGDSISIIAIPKETTKQNLLLILALLEHAR
jgi:hypothetical protein